MRLDVALRSLTCMFARMFLMAMCQMRMVGSFFVLAAFVVPGSLAVMTSCVSVVFCRMLVMLCCFFGHVVPLIDLPTRKLVRMRILKEGESLRPYRIVNLESYAFLQTLCEAILSQRKSQRTERGQCAFFLIHLSCTLTRHLCWTPERKFLTRVPCVLANVIKVIF